MKIIAILLILLYCYRRLEHASYLIHLLIETSRLKWVGLDGYYLFLLTFVSTYSIPIWIYLVFLRMAKLKQTARKSTGDRGVPHHRLAPKKEESGGSKSEPQTEIKRLIKELNQVNRAYDRGAICNNKL